MNRLRFYHLAWGLLAYNVAVVLWGAVVRASGSGDGCADHWPSCGGQLVPTNVQHAKTWVEYGHRVSTALLLPLILWMLFWAFRDFSKGHPVRKSAVAILFFTLIEAWIGRFLVIHKLVAMDSSVQRVIWLALHLTNIFALLTALTLTAWWSWGGAILQVREHKKLAWLWAACLVSVLVLAVTGAMSALGDTLYPATSLAEGMRHDFAPNAVAILKLRPLHPLTAVFVSLFVAWTIASSRRLRSTLWVEKLSRPVTAILCAQFIFGIVNLLMMAPVWMQVTHLLLANLLWIGLVVLGASAVGAENPLPETLEEKQSGEVSRTWQEPIPLIR